MPRISPNQNNENPDEYQMLAKLQIAMAIGVLAIALYTLQFGWHRTALTVFGVAIVGAGASLGAGFLLGCVFGIPRAVTPKKEIAATVSTGSNAEPVPAAGNSHTFEANSNLVEISDWLTKIFVGVGLVELGKIPVKMKALASYFAAGLRNCADRDANCVPTSETFAMVVLVFFGICGFLLGYFWARFYLLKAFDESRKAKEKAEEAQSWIFVLQSRMLTGIGTASEPNLKDVDLDSLKKGMELLDKGLEKYPDEFQLHFEKAYVAKEIACKSQPIDTDLLRQALAHAYRAADLASDDRDVPNIASALYNIACYQALLNKDPKEILPNLRDAIKLKPELRITAQDDEDLLSLRGVPEYEKLINP
jgi:hypothetical protein